MMGPSTVLIGMYVVLASRHGDWFAVCDTGPTSEAEPSHTLKPLPVPELEVCDLGVTLEDLPDDVVAFPDIPASLYWLHRSPPSFLVTGKQIGRAHV